MTDLRTAWFDEVKLILEWAATEGWNPGLEDAEAFYAADPDGFFIASEDGKPVAAISVVNHTDAFAFLGLYIVLPAYRGRGIGLALWNHALEHAGSRIVGLDGVPEQQANYTSSGFAHAGGTTRFTGAVKPLADPDIKVIQGGDDTSHLIAAEAAASGVVKAAYLKTWFTQTKTRVTFQLGDKAFCTVRECQEGAKIGPLIAQTKDEAERLMRHAAQMVPGPISIDVPHSAAPLTALCDTLGMTAGFSTARMYRGTGPVAPAGFFSVTSLELG